MSGTLLHLGAGALQIPSLLAAMEAGLKVVAVDRDPEAPGRHMVERCIHASVDDGAAVLRAAREIEDLAGLYCGGDHGLATVTRVSTLLGLPAPSVETLSNLMDKFTATEMWRAAGIATTEGVRVASLDEARAALVRMDGPAILKPSSSSGSRGVRSVDSLQDLEKAWAAATEFGDRIVLERLLQGRHIDANACIVEGQLVRCGLLDRHFTLPPTHVPLWGSQPASLTEAETDAVYDLVAKAAAAVGLEAGPVKADLVLTDKGPHLLELAPRLHGDISSSHVAPVAQGWHPALPWFHHLAGGEWHKPAEPAGRRLIGWRAVLNLEAGRFLRLEGLDAASDMAGILKILVIRRNGQIVPAATDNRAVIAFVVGEGDGLIQLKTRLSAAAGMLRPIIATADRHRF